MGLILGGVRGKSWSDRGEEGGVLVGYDCFKQYFKSIFKQCFYIKESFINEFLSGMVQNCLI